MPASWFRYELSWSHILSRLPFGHCRNFHDSTIPRLEVGFLQQHIPKPLGHQHLLLCLSLGQLLEELKKIVGINLFFFNTCKKNEFSFLSNFKKGQLKKLFLDCSVFCEAACYFYIIVILTVLYLKVEPKGGMCGNLFWRVSDCLLWMVDNMLVEWIKGETF